MALVLLPDAQRAIALYLRAHAELAELGDRIYTVTPKDVGADPFVLVRRVGGEPARGGVPLVLDAPELQVDSYGGAKRDAHRWGQVVRAVLAELDGTIGDGMFEAHVTGVRLGAFRDLADETFEPARARYVGDVTVYLKRGRAVLPGSTTSAAVTAGGTTP